VSIDAVGRHFDVATFEDDHKLDLDRLTVGGTPGRNHSIRLVWWNRVIASSTTEFSVATRLVRVGSHPSRIDGMKSCRQRGRERLCLASQDGGNSQRRCVLYHGGE
jgi:hypothetical protein